MSGYTVQSSQTLSILGLLPAVGGWGRGAPFCWVVAGETDGEAWVGRRRPCRKDESLRRRRVGLASTILVGVEKTECDAREGRVYVVWEEHQGRTHGAGTTREIWPRWTVPLEPSLPE